MRETEGLEVLVSLLSLPFVLLVGYLDGVFFLLFPYVLAGFRVAGLFETELHVALVGLLFMPFSGFLFVSARSVAVPQCEFRGPFVKAVGKEKGKGTPTSCFWGVSDPGLGSSFLEGNLLCGGKFIDPGGSLLCGRSAVHAHLTSGRASDPRWTCV